MYTAEEVDALIEVQRDGEGLREIEVRLSTQWVMQQLRDGRSRDEIVRELRAMAEAECVPRGDES